jgi:hypothetical protein
VKKSKSVDGHPYISEKKKKKKKDKKGLCHAQHDPKMQLQFTRDSSCTTYNF